jgi:hypothetical protein
MVTAASVAGATLAAGVMIGAARPATQPARQPDIPAKPEPMTGRSLEDQAAAVEKWNAPTDMHALLASLAGTWDVEMTMYPNGDENNPMTMPAVSENRMVLGGKFLEERLRGTGPMPFETMSLTGFNADAKGGPRFECVRLSSMVAAQMPEQGTFDPATRTFTFTGSHDINGMTGTIRNVAVMEGKDRHVVTSYLSYQGYGEKFKDVKVPEHLAMRLVMTRRAADK